MDGGVVDRGPADGGGVDDGRHDREVLDENPVVERLVAVVQVPEQLPLAHVLLGDAGPGGRHLAADAMVEAIHEELRLLVEGLDARWEEAAKTKALAVVVVEALASADRWRGMMVGGEERKCGGCGAVRGGKSARGGRGMRRGEESGLECRVLSAPVENGVVQDICSSFVSKLNPVVVLVGALIFGDVIFAAGKGAGPEGSRLCVGVDICGAKGGDSNIRMKIERDRRKHGEQYVIFMLPRGSGTAAR